MNFWQKTKRFYEPVLRYPGLCIGASGGAALIGSGTGYFLIYITKVFAEYFADFSADNFWPQVLYVLTIFFIFIIFTYITKDYVWIYPQIKVEQDIEKEYFRRFVRSDNLAAERIGTGRTIAIMRLGIEKWSIMTNDTINNIFRWIALVVFSLILFSATSFKLALLFLVLFVVITVNMVVFSKYGLYWRMKRKEISVEQVRIETKIIMSKFEILQNGNIEKETDKICSLLDQIKEYAKKSQATNVGSWQISRALIALFMIGICANFYYEARDFGVSQELLAQLGIQLGLMTTFSSYFNLLIEYYINFTKDFVHVQKLWDAFDELPQMQGIDTGKSFTFKSGKFEFKNISYSYSTGNEILRNFSLTIEGGKKTALVGRSGGGKTTLMKLLAGYMRPTSGSLRIDQQDITDIRLDSYYPHIGYLTQEPSVFDGTIEENLLYSAKRKLQKKEIEKAIELAECQFIYELEHGIKTEIGERGIRLSGGQKQRLAIAKIFLKDPEIILLDEPTAALDSYSEEKVAKAFEHLFEGRTVIVIAHRLQTVKSADDIIVLEKGEVVERGTHKELLKLGGKYAGMVDLQSGVVKEEDNEEKYAE